jgi:hypothetical protein
MVDSCFVCLIDTNHRVCDQCTIHCHYKCWEKHWKYFNHKRLSHDGIDCPQCKNTIKDRITIKSYRLVNKEYLFRKELSKIMNKLKNINNKQEKRLLLQELCEYVYENIWYFRDNYIFEIDFRKMTININNTNDNWYFPSFIYKKIFKEDIPNYY